MSKPCNAELAKSRSRLLKMETDLAKRARELQVGLQAIKPILKDNFNALLFLQYGNMKGEYRAVTSSLKELRRAIRHIGNWDHPQFRVKTVKEAENHEVVD